MLIEGLTKCPICNLPILRHVDATRLPYANPNSLVFLSEENRLVFSVRPYVHQQCWNGWEFKSKFANSAFQLARAGATENTVGKLRFYPNTLTTIQEAPTATHQVQDYLNLITLEIESFQIKDFCLFLKLSSEESFKTVNDVVITKTASQVQFFKSEKNTTTPVAICPLDYAHSLLQNLNSFIAE